MRVSAPFVLLLPVFPGVTDFEVNLLHQAEINATWIWLGNLNLRGGFKKDTADYICKNILIWFHQMTPFATVGTEAFPVVWRIKLERAKKENSCPFVDNERSTNGQGEPGHPVRITYHEAVAWKTPASNPKNNL